MKAFVKKDQHFSNIDSLAELRNFLVLENIGNPKNVINNSFIHKPYPKKVKSTFDLFFVSYSWKLV